LSLDNGPVISGAIDDPLDDKFITSGSGSWHVDSGSPPPQVLAGGSIKGSGTTLSAIFAFEGKTYGFIGKFTSGTLPSFEVQNAKLAFNTTADLAGTQTFTGFVGQNDLSWNLANGPTMTGPLDTPLSNEFSTNGSGFWSVSSSAHRGV